MQGEFEPDRTDNVYLKSFSELEIAVVFVHIHAMRGLHELGIRSQRTSGTLISQRITKKVLIFHSFMAETCHDLWRYTSWRKE